MVAVAASAWGTWSLFLRPTGLPGTVSGPVVLLMMGLWALPLALREPATSWDRRTVGLLALNTVCDAVNVVTFFAAIEHTSVAIAVLTHYLAPVLIALAAPRVDGTAVRGAPAAAVIATAGLALVLEPWRAGGAALGLGAALGATSAVAYAGNVFVVRRLAARIGASRAIAYHSLLAAIVVAPLGAGHLDAIDAGDLAYLGAGSLLLGALAGIGFVAGLSRIGSARAAVLTFLEPLVAVIVGWTAFGEGLGPIAALGGALILGAGLWVVRAPARATASPG